MKVFWEQVRTLKISCLSCPESIIKWKEGAGSKVEHHIHTINDSTIIFAVPICVLYVHFYQRETPMQECKRHLPRNSRHTFSWISDLCQFYYSPNNPPARDKKWGKTLGVISLFPSFFSINRDHLDYIFNPQFLLSHFIKALNRIRI